jgi:hypothetical protein
MIMKKLIFLLFLIPFYSYCQFDGRDTLHVVNIKGNKAGSITGLSGAGNNIIKRTSANTLLPKIADLEVLAFGNITDTLPAVTASDSGLCISIKNSVTYTDLITIVAKGGKTIDGTANSTLTRWRGRTYVVSNSANWIIKEKETRADNLYDVSAKGSFTTIEEVVAFLNLHMTTNSVVRLGGGIYTLSATQIINLPYPVTFEGLSYGETKIAAASGLANKPMFRCLSAVFFKMLVFDATTLASYGTLAGEDAIRLLGSGTYNEIKDCSINGFYNGIIDSTNAELWCFENDINSSNYAGVYIHGAVAGVKVRFNATDFIQGRRGIVLSKASSAYVDVDGGCAFIGQLATDTMVLYKPATFGYSYFWVAGTRWNNTGVYFVGFDFTTAGAANIYMQNNAGSEDYTPHFKLNVLNSTDTTRTVTANIFYKAKFTQTITENVKYTIAANKVTYLPTNKRNVWFVITGNMSCDNPNKTISYGICKNGIRTTRYGEQTLRTSTAAQQCQFATIVYLYRVAPSDYFEFYVSSATNGDIITISDLNWGSWSQ